MQLFHRYTPVLLFLFFFAPSIRAQGIEIIPEPVQVTQSGGRFSFNRETKIYMPANDSLLQATVRLFVQEFADQTGIKPGTVAGPSDRAPAANSIVIKVSDTAGRFSKKESYELNIQPDVVRITASDAAGLFYAFQSLLQLIQTGGDKKAKETIVPCALIYDSPRFGYRGMHLDVSRHFFPPAFIKKYLDILARYKINTFHWHFTDSHGWRMEVKKYHRLTSVGAWRADRSGIPMTIALPTQPGEKATYGGFYTQEEIKDLIRYASERFITIIPEIEMPGHCTAALVAYPEYTCLNNPVPLLMPTGYAGDLLHNFCPGYDSTFVFLNNILKEVMDLFPSTYIHIGGDEVRGGSWLNCPRCQQRMKEKGYTTARQLQAYFTARIDSFVTASGRKSIGWDEILEAGDLSPNAAVMSWRGTAGGIEGARKGHKVVMTPYRYTYFDFYQSDPELEPDITYAGLFLDSVYAFEPVAGLSDRESGNVLGVQACLWTENIASEERVEYMLLPRLLALAEAAWSPRERKDYARFVDKLENEMRYLQKKNINYAKSMYNVSIRPFFDTARRRPTIALRNQAGGKYKVYYTTDGSAPTFKSALYPAPIPVQKSMTLRTALFDGGRQLGKINTQAFSVHGAIGIAPTVLPAVEDREALAAYRKLTDGIFGTIEPYDGRWVFFRDSVVTLTIDLQSPRSINKISFRVLEDKVGNAFLPARITCLTSQDGHSFEEAFTVTNTKVPQQDLRHIVPYAKTIGRKGRFVKLAFAQSEIGSKPPEQLLFLDEIVIQ